MVGSGGREQAILDAVLALKPVRAVLTIAIGEADARPLVALRIGVPSALGLTDVARVIGQVQAAVADIEPGARTFVEPQPAVDSAAPTEAIVIRALE